MVHGSETQYVVSGFAPARKVPLSREFVCLSQRGGSCVFTSHPITGHKRPESDTLSFGRSGRRCNHVRFAVVDNAPLE
jgi:hypothetical protein